MNEQPLTSWDLDRQVFFCGGYGWGIKKVEVGELKTVCLGLEEEVKKRLAHKRSGIREKPQDTNLGGLKM